jgi:hypothetical protein
MGSNIIKIISAKNILVSDQFAGLQTFTPGRVSLAAAPVPGQRRDGKIKPENQCQTTAKQPRN